MLGRIFAILLIVLGLGTAAAGIASGTVWRPDETVTATLPQEPEAPVVLARTHVLATVNPDVTVTVTGPDEDTPLVLVMGRTAEVHAWLDGADAVEITGLTSWETLRVADGDAASEEPTTDETTSPSTDDAVESESPSPEESESPTEEDEEAEAASTVPNPAGSDLWIEELTGTGELTYEWTQVEGDWTMLVATDGTEPAPAVSLTWDREVTTPLMIPGIVVGSVLFLIGAVWLTILLLMAREEKRARKRAQSSDEDSTSTTTTTLTAVDGTTLTRRQLREAERAEARRSHGGAGDTADAAESSAGHDDEPDTADEPDGAGDLDAWVRGGASEQAPDDDVDHPDSAKDTNDTNDASSETTPEEEQTGQLPIRRQWWRRRRSDAPEAAAGEDENENGSSLRQPSSWGAPTIGAAGTSEEAGSQYRVERAEPADETKADETNAQASGASWRQTWGLGTTTPEPADQVDTDQADPEEERS
ncbi:hypothetical protein [Ruania rhizosphaerae]|uniref:hypothetical protein n=1 Tax=Ruania rhizosphaerae TaxID=1840413 RepID=UPI00135B067E|nr:hypothetical protein [Ruania rhizosphaerae]